MPKPLEHVMKPIFLKYTLKESEELSRKKDEYDKVWKRISNTHEGKGKDEIHKLFLERVYEIEIGPQSINKEANEFRSMFPEYFCDSRYDEEYPEKVPMGQPLILPDDFNDMVKGTIDTYIHKKNKKGEKLTCKNLKEDQLEDLLVKFHELARLFLKPKYLDAPKEKQVRPLNLAMQPVLRKYSDRDKCDIFAFLYTAICKAAGINAKAAWDKWHTDHWESRVLSPRNGWITVDWPGGINVDEGRLGKISEDTKRSIPW
jgi:hypothetical protein